MKLYTVSFFPLLFRADQRWTNESNKYKKTPLEIALEGTWHFKVLMQIASFVNEDTPSSDKLKILRMFMEKFSWGVEDGYEEQFKRCLDGVPVSEVIVFFILSWQYSSIVIQH